MRLKFFKEAVSVATGLLMIYFIAYYSVVFFKGKEIWFFYVSIAITALFTKLAVSYALNPKSLSTDIKGELTKGEAGEFHIVSIPLLLFFSFSLTSYYGWLSYGEKFLIVESSGPITWLAYGLDNFIRATLFDFAEIYGIDLSKIEHNTSILPSTFVFVFRTAMSLSFITIIWFSIKHTIKNQS